MNEDEIRKAIAVMEGLLSAPAKLEGLSPELRVDLMSAAGRLSRPDREALRLRNREIDRERRRKIVRADKEVRRASGIREARRQTVFTAPAQLNAPAPEARRLTKPRACYVCKTAFDQLHFFYDSMCPVCAELNYRKRFQTAPLDGQVALITGARLKIGYQSALMMLRAGAHVIATTRFPVDAAERFARESDFSEWRDRLEVHGLDLRHTPSVEIFTHFIEQTHARLDILINNAAQTVRRPPGFYAHLMPLEREGAQTPGARALLSAHERCKVHLRASEPAASFASAAAPLPVQWHAPTPGVGLLASAELSQIPYAFERAHAPAELFPSGRLDADLQQVDLRHINSWRLGLADVPTLEMLEVQLVNSIAPFVLCSRLTPLMRRHPTGQKHIVNVTAMEGKFTRFTKTDKHPHTNMAKAALNMMTHTSARDLVKDGIYMNAVDTGWVTDEDPLAISLRKQDEHDFQPPLDIVDGAARVCDPFFDGILTGKHWCGKFLKDYFPTDW